MARAEAELAKMAKIYTVDVSHVPQYVKYFDISLVPSTVFFFSAHHMKVDCGCVRAHGRALARVHGGGCCGIVDVARLASCRAPLGHQR